MRTATRRLVIAAATVAFLLYLGWDMFSGIAGRPTAASAPLPHASAAAPAPSLPTPTTTPGAVSAPSGRARATYSIAVREVAGLSATTYPGTVVDIWVIWDRPVTESPRLQRLIRDVVVDQIAPPVTPDGPYVGILSVEQRKIDELLWADRYGALSATTPSTR